MLSLFAQNTSILIKFAYRLLTLRQKKTLIRLAHLSGVPATQAVFILSNSLSASPSSIWFILKQLRELELAQFGTIRTKGIPIQLTPTGTLVARGLAQFSETSTPASSKDKGGGKQ